MFEFDVHPNLQIKKIDLNKVGIDFNIYKNKTKQQTHDNVEFDLYHNTYIFYGVLFVIIGVPVKE